MKRIYTFLAVFFISFSLSAQTAFNYFDLDFRRHTNYKMHVIDSAILDFDSGRPGADQTWDFRTLPRWGRDEIMTVTNCIGDADCDEYRGDGANVKTSLSNGGGTSVYKYDENGYRIFSDSYFDTEYPDKEKFTHRFPIVYNQTYGDSIGIGFIGVMFESITDVKVDGYGTLITPYGRFENVIRQSTYEVANYEGKRFLFETIVWLKADYDLYLMKYAKVHVDGDLDDFDPLYDKRIAQLSYVNSNPLDIEDVNALSKQINIFPNPFNDLINIELEGHFIEKVEIFNVVGAKVFELLPKVNDKVMVRDIHLNQGNYIMKVYTDKGIGTKMLTSM